MAIRFFVGHGASGSAASMPPTSRGSGGAGSTPRRSTCRSRRPRTPSPRSARSSPTDPDADGAADRGRWPVVRRPGRQPRRRRARHGLRGARLLQLSAPSARARRSKAEERTSHWPAIRCPVLLLSGRGRPVRPDRPAPGRRPAAPRRPSSSRTRGSGHTLKPVLDDALDRAAAFLEALRAETNRCGRARHSARRALDTATYARPYPRRRCDTESRG